MQPGQSQQAQADGNEDSQSSYISFNHTLSHV